MVSIANRYRLLPDARSSALDIFEIVTRYQCSSTKLSWRFCGTIL